MSLENIILKAWDDRNNINKNSDKAIISVINETLEKLDSGSIRVCEKKNNEWHTHQWIKKAILLSFKIQDNKILSGPYATACANTALGLRLSSVILTEREVRTCSISHLAIRPK